MLQHQGMINRLIQFLVMTDFHPSDALLLPVTSFWSVINNGQTYDDARPFQQLVEAL